MADKAESGDGRLMRVLRIAPWIGAALLFLLPVAAKSLSDLPWTAFDFFVWGLMLLVACGAFELMMRMSGHWAYRVGAAVAIGAGFLLVWINLAVGIIGSEDEPANLMYAGVLCVGVVGAAVGRFEARPMALTLFAMAGLTVAAGLIALVSGWGAEGENWPQVIIVLTGVFAALWSLSGGLFRRAVRAQERTGAAA